MLQNFRRQLLISAAFIVGMSLTSTSAQAATLGFADVVLDFFDSGAGPLPGSYGGEFPGGIGFPVPVSTDVVLGNDLGASVNFLSLPTGSFVTVGFTDETVIDGPGNDIFIREVAPQGERADIFVSSNLIDFIFLGTANDGVTTSFDLASIGFAGAVQAVKIVGLDNFGGSPGFDVSNVEVLPGSIGPEPEPVPEPASITGFLAISVLGFSSLMKRQQPRKA